MGKPGLAWPEVMVEVELLAFQDQAAIDSAMMVEALGLAREAMQWGEVPVGAVVVHEGRILAQAFNLRETLRDPTAHAERLALTLAGQRLGSWRLEGCTLYVTLEPCPMCAGAIVLSRLDRVVYAVADPKTGACDSLYRLLADPRLNHRPSVVSGILAGEAGAILSDFFQRKRLLQTP
jgi:tRNA(adenine34) deaminase